MQYCSKVASHHSDGARAWECATEDEGSVLLPSLRGAGSSAGRADADAMIVISFLKGLPGRVFFFFSSFVLQSSHKLVWTKRMPFLFL